jgi:hypothetical protein
MDEKQQSCCWVAAFFYCLWALIVIAHTARSEHTIRLTSSVKSIRTSTTTLSGAGLNV